MSPMCPWRSVNACGAQGNRKMGSRLPATKREVWLLELRNFGHLFIINLKSQMVQKKNLLLMEFLLRGKELK